MFCLRKLGSVGQVTRRSIPEEGNHKLGLYASTRDVQKTEDNSICFCKEITW